MKLQDLFEMCDNLGSGTIIRVHNEQFKFVESGSYPEMHALYGGREIISFRIHGEFNGNATVYLAGV